jgi:catechol 2,3-dioxygenase-like lactoylglutathione lyase family enzyme
MPSEVLFEDITIAVPDIAFAREALDAWLGPFTTVAEGARRQLRNTGILLLESDAVSEATIRGVTLRSPTPSVADRDIDCRGLGIRLLQAVEQARGATLPAGGITAVDHLVLHTTDADDCIRLFQRELGLRLALDQTVPEWGGRMLFFRSGKLTLEVIERQDAPPASDYFWGITYQCADLEDTLAALDRAGVAHSPLRAGRKPGTRVATLKSHHLGIPTLLLEPSP